MDTFVAYQPILEDAIFPAGDILKAIVELKAYDRPVRSSQVLWCRSYRSPVVAVKKKQ